MFILGQDKGCEVWGRMDGWWRARTGRRDKGTLGGLLIPRSMLIMCAIVEIGWRLDVTVP
jgi:hypothetical protein